MDAARWGRVEALFHEARSYRGQAREAFLDAACGGDGDLRAEVESLLAHEAKSDAFLAQPALQETAGRGDVASPMAPASGAVAPGTQIGVYRIVRRLGEGGMGVVYEAIDPRLERRLALKLLRAESEDPAAHARLVREARVAAKVVHPLVCQVYELGDADGRPYIAMELVEGESLADRLARGPMPASEAIRTAATMLDALAVLHGHGIVHRDLKPSNVFLGPTGLKLLDFGLARPIEAPADATGHALTAAGMFVGTPQYASPEQLRGEAVDVRSDLFSAAVIAFEMLAGRPPFSGGSLAALVHAVMFDTPPVLSGSPAVAAADRVLHRALAKSAVERHPTAEGFAADLRASLHLVDTGQAVQARPILRLAVLPFRQLKPDADTAYLGPSLADVLAGSFAGLESLVVRSTLKSVKYAGASLDLERVAAELAVDVVLTGSLLPSRGRVRVAAELVAAPSGDVWWSHVTDASADAVLELHDDLARRVLAALPISARDKGAPTEARAGNAKAFDLYLRGLQLRAEAGVWRQAHHYFVQSLQLDPEFASAWAERGRLERILGKYEDAALLPVASASLRRALTLNPDHGAAQYYAAQLDVDLGRVDVALARLLNRAAEQRAEPHVMAALVHACRYGGLLDASVAAHAAATRLDPTVATSVLHTYYMQGDYARALADAHRSSDPLEARVLGAMGRRDEARAAARAEEARFAAIPLLSAFSSGLRAALDGDVPGVSAALARFEASHFVDGEGFFYWAEICAAVGLDEPALALLTRAVDAGFLCLSAYDRDVYLAPLRGHAAWTSLRTRLAAAQAVVAREFDRSRGPALLGIG